MGKLLIIVESPAKAISISKYLGNEFKALASYGHIRDLLPKAGAVNPDQNFQIHYSLIKRKRKYIDLIVHEMKKSDSLYLATDPDREGEAIAWHIVEVLKEKNVIGDKSVYRVKFHEFTRTAIQNAVKNPQPLSMNLIDAYQARRILDYLIGFNLSPILWKKIRWGLSAGRVQSPALRLICAREEERKFFIKKEYWTIEADLNIKRHNLFGKLIHFKGEKITRFSILNETDAKYIKQVLNSNNHHLTVKQIERKEKELNPSPPFTTSTLQQEASRKLGFTVKRTMHVAQKLYEGVKTKHGSIELITYMRTDSVVLSQTSTSEIRKCIRTLYGKDFLSKKTRIFKNKTTNVQEAHESIRPTSCTYLPEILKTQISEDAYRLYQLIWRRTIACQMIQSVIDTIKLDVSIGNVGIFRSCSSFTKISGFMIVYQDIKKRQDLIQKNQSLMPSIKQGMDVCLNKIQVTQHFTEPPPLYNEANLVKKLESYGIGRPSTYATIIEILKYRKYVTFNQCGNFSSTDMGNIVNQFLSNHFSKYVNYEFTATMEDNLDQIARGETHWIPLMEEFWNHFSQHIEQKKKTISREQVIQTRTLGIDPKSGKTLSVKIGLYGSYAQIGTSEDDEKPIFSSLLPGQKLDTISFQEALSLFQLPRYLGKTQDGETMTVSIGRFGPYIKYGDQYVSLEKKHDPYTVELKVVQQIIAQKKSEISNRILINFEGSNIQILNGHYGIYLTDGKKNISLTKKITHPSSLTLNECKTLLKKAKHSKKNTKKINKLLGTLTQYLHINSFLECVHYTHLILKS